MKENDNSKYSISWYSENIRFYTNTRIKLFLLLSTVYRVIAKELNNNNTVLNIGNTISYFLSTELYTKYRYRKNNDAKTTSSLAIKQ